MDKNLSIDTRIYPVEGHGKLLARASVTLGGCFAVTGVQIMRGKNDEPFVSMPRWKSGAEYKDICFPCTKEFHQKLNGTILSAFEQTMSEQAQRQARAQSQPEAQSQMEPEMSM